MEALVDRLRIRLNRILLSAAKGAGLFDLSRRRHRRDLRIVTYHGVEDCEDPILNAEGMQVSPRLFEQQLDALLRHLRPYSMGEVITQFLEHREWPENGVVITFDDGYQNNLEIAAPILRRKGVPAAFFMTTGFVEGRCYPWWYAVRGAIAKTRRTALTNPITNDAGIPIESPEKRRRAVFMIESALVKMPEIIRRSAIRRLLEQCEMDEAKPFPMLDWAGVRALANQGFEIGNHTDTHLSLSHEPVDVVLAELETAQMLLKKHVARPLPVAAYPYGHVPVRLEALAPRLQQMSLYAGLTTTLGLNPSKSDPLLLKRLDMSGHRDPTNVESLISGFTQLVAGIKQKVA